MLAHRFRFLPLLAIVLACSSPTAPMAEGDWGGTSASLSLSRSGGVLSYACGTGTMDSAWVLSPDGLLSGAGQHFFGGGDILHMVDVDDLREWKSFKHIPLFQKMSQKISEPFDTLFLNAFDFVEDAGG